MDANPKVPAWFALMRGGAACVLGFSIGKAGSPQPPAIHAQCDAAANLMLQGERAEAQARIDYWRKLSREYSESATRYAREADQLRRSK